MLKIPHWDSVVAIHPPIHGLVRVYMMMCPVCILHSSLLKAEELCLDYLLCIVIICKASSIILSRNIVPYDKNLSVAIAMCGFVTNFISASVLVALGRSANFFKNPASEPNFWIMLRVL